MKALGVFMDNSARRSNMFCGKCRTENPDDNTFCIKCGADIAAMKTPTMDVQTPAADKKFIEQFQGRVFANCKIERKLGEGGMGAVFLGMHSSLDRPRAIKILPRELASNSVYIQRFFKEAKSAAALQHPNIVQVYDAGEQDGFCYLVMEFVKGDSIAGFIRKKGPYHWKDAVPLLRQSLSAFKAAHDANIIHRDIKPDNIMLTEDGQVKIADFGLAKNVSETTGLTKTGQVMGTPQYMSPEQCLGNPTDRRSDIYSLGATAYTMLTGRPMFTAETPIALLRMQVDEAPLPIGQAVPGTPAQLVQIINKMIAKDLNGRYQSADEVIRDLDKLLDGPAAETAPKAAAKPAIPKKSREIAARSTITTPAASPKSSAPAPQKTPPPEAKPKPAAQKEEAEPKKKFPAIPVAIAGGIVAVAAVVIFLSVGSKTEMRKTSAAPPATITGKTAAGDTAARTFSERLGKLQGQFAAAGQKLDLENANATVAEMEKEVGKSDLPESRKILADARAALGEINKKLETFEALIKNAEESKSAGRFDTALLFIEQARNIKKVPDPRLDELAVEIESSKREAAEKEDALRKDQAFADALNTAKNNGDWASVTMLLKDRQNLTPEQANLLILAQVEQMAPVNMADNGQVLFGVYEVTNVQFLQFVEDGGYGNEEFWSEAGWEWREKNGVTEPKFWRSADFNENGSQPVVGVSFHEAEAYAKWAKKRLPTVEEWKAAAGDAKWPWGNDAAANRANTREGMLNKTVKVGSYPAGASPSGCQDMAGNAMEWCVAKDGKPACLGGSWKTMLDDSKTSSRFNLPPETRDNHIGFRLIKDK
jgi:serine/threonine-protein kinase